MSDPIDSVDSQPPQDATSSKPTDDTSERREPSDLAEQAEVFRNLMAGLPLTAEQLGMLAGGGGNKGLRTPGRQSEADEMRRHGLDVSSMLAMQRTNQLAAPPTVQAPPPAAAPPDMSVAELIDKHVRRALSSQQLGRASGGEVRLELSDAVLPGTALSLRQTADGWQLSARADNKQSLDRLNEFAPELVKRFSQASLGRLEISVESGSSL